MSQTGPEQSDAKARKSRVTKATKQQDAKGKQKMSVYISVDSARRVGITATMTGRDKSQVIESLIQAGLRDWVVQYRPASVKPEGTSSEPEAETS
jgi:hypothetical protein